MSTNAPHENQQQQASLLISGKTLLINNPKKMSTTMTRTRFLITFLVLCMAMMVIKDASRHKSHQGRRSRRLEQVVKEEGEADYESEAQGDDDNDDGEQDMLEDINNNNNNHDHKYKNVDKTKEKPATPISTPPTPPPPLPPPSTPEKTPPQTASNHYHQTDEKAPSTPTTPIAFPTSNTTSPTTLGKPKTILYYTKFFNLANYSFGEGQDPFIDNGCPVTNCIITADRDYYKDGDMGKFDAVIFHPLNMGSAYYDHITAPDLPWRRRHQRFIMFMKEAPLEPSYYFYGKQAVRRGHFPYEQFAGFFNWTMTYRLDSDIPVPHGWFFEQSQGLRTTPVRSGGGIQWPSEEEIKIRQANVVNIVNATALNWKQRRLSVVWLVSHCWTNSNREGFVKELMKYTTVMVYGGCSKRPCDKDCIDSFTAKYKFYLALENNLCKHYVTEKFWWRINSYMIPIVIGEDAHYKEMAPPHSYIHAGDFPSVSALADYLDYLAQNQTAFMSYFWWKDQYKLDVTRSMKVGMCEMCRMLNDEGLPKKSYRDLKDWWWTKSQCRMNPEWT